MHHVTGLAHFLPPPSFQESIFTAAHSLAWPYTQLQGNSPALQTFLSWVMGFEVTQSRAKTRDDENVLMGLFQTSEMWWCIMLNAIGDIVLLFYFVLQGEKRKLLLYREIYKGASCNHSLCLCLLWETARKALKVLFISFFVWSNAPPPPRFKLTESFFMGDCWGLFIFSSSFCCCLPSWQYPQAAIHLWNR